MVLAVISCCAFAAAVSGLVHAYKSQKAYEKQLENLLIQLQAAEGILKKRGDLAREVAHEIKNPITAILCSAEALDLLIGSSLEPAHRKSLCYIKEYGQYVLHLISDFLDLSMIEAHVKEANPKQVELGPVVESVLGLLDSAALRHHVRVKYQACSEDLAVYVDPKHLRQILFSVLHNAIKFSHEKGEVRVICQDTFPHTQIKISVKDYGGGMDADGVARMFDPYGRRSCENEDGHGLGMPLAKSLVELAGGKMAVMSEPGVGTCVEVCLPGAAPSELEAEGEFEIDEAKQLKPLLGFSFLLVDKDEGTRNTVTALIEAWGGMVDKVSEAAEAVRILPERGYDAVMLDAHEAESSEGMIGELLRDGQTQLILTSREPLRAELLEALKAKKILEKPFNGRKLLRSLLESTHAAAKHQ